MKLCFVTAELHFVVGAPGWRRPPRSCGKYDKIGLVQELAGAVTGGDEGTPYNGKFKEKPAKE